MRQLGFVGLAWAIVFAFCPLSSAGIVTHELDYEFSGATAPAGSTPWLEATFDDSFGGANTVRLTMEAVNLVGTEYVSEWLFNFDPTLDPTQLTFAVVDNSDSVPNSISTGVNAFAADGDGYFDVRFVFPPPPGTFPQKFTAAEEVIYDITYVAPISASSFDFFSAPGGGAGTYKSAAHVQGIGPTGDDSGWIGPRDGAIPEPAGLIVWSILAGVVGVAVACRRRKV